MEELIYTIRHLQLLLKTIKNVIQKIFFSRQMSNINALLWRRIRWKVNSQSRPTGMMIEFETERDGELMRWMKR